MTLDALYLAAVVACTVASLVGFAAWFWKGSPALQRWGAWLGIASLIVTFWTWTQRWYVAGHLPIFGTHESALSLAVAVLASSLIIRRKELWPVTTAVAALLLVHGRGFMSTPLPLTISERSWVVDVHAVVAWAAFGCLAVNAALALSKLVGRPKHSEATNRLLSFTLSAGFALHTGMLASGSIYKFLLFGQTWSFDPIETLGFVAWIAYGTLLHLHLMAGWDGARLAKWCLPLFLLLAVSYRSIVYFPAWSTYHIFDLDLRLHINPADVPSSRGGS